MPAWLAPVLSAGASLASGFLANRSQERQADQNLEFQERWNMRGEEWAREQVAAQQASVAADRQFAREQWNEAYRIQRQGIQDRVADARAAGIHPLFAMGTNVSLPNVQMPSSFVGADFNHNPPPGQSPRGDHFSDGIARGLGTVAEHIAAERLKKSPEYKIARARESARYAMEMMEARARIQKDQAIAAAALSDAAVARSRAGSKNAPAIKTPEAAARQGVEPGKRFTSVAGPGPKQGSQVDAEDIERRYGGIAAEVYGIGSLMKDVGSQHIDDFKKWWSD